MARLNENIDLITIYRRMNPYHQEAWWTHFLEPYKNQNLIHALLVCQRDQINVHIAKRTWERLHHVLIYINIYYDFFAIWITSSSSMMWTSPTRCGLCFVDVPYTHKHVSERHIIQLSFTDTHMCAWISHFTHVVMRTQMSAYLNCAARSRCTVWQMPSTEVPFRTITGPPKSGASPRRCVRVVYEYSNKCIRMSRMVWMWAVDKKRAKCAGVVCMSIQTSAYSCKACIEDGVDVSCGWKVCKMRTREHIYEYSNNNKCQLSPFNFFLLSPFYKCECVLCHLGVNANEIEVLPYFDQQMLQSKVQLATVHDTMSNQYINKNKKTKNATKEETMHTASLFTCMQLRECKWARAYAGQ